jgi:hypothetical protein
MANTNVPKKKREPRAWLYENGVRKPLVVEKPTRLSKIGILRRENPAAFSVGLTEDDIRALHFQG